MTLKKTFITAAVLAALPLAACSKAPQTEAVAPAVADVAAQAMAVKANAVLIYADWCSSCKVLDPKVKAAKSAFDGKGLNFVTLDYTKKDKADFMAQAEAAGVEIAIAKAMGDSVKTGQLIVVSADGERVLSKVNMNHTKAEIAAKFTSALKNG